MIAELNVENYFIVYYDGNTSDQVRQYMYFS